MHYFKAHVDTKTITHDAKVDVNFIFRCLYIFFYFLWCLSDVEIFKIEQVKNVFNIPILA